MLRKELIEENERLKIELRDVCEHHKRALKIIDKKTEQIRILEARLKSAKEN